MAAPYFNVLLDFKPGGTGALSLHLIPSAYSAFVPPCRKRHN